MQNRLLDKLVAETPGTVHLVLEHFNFEMQYLLDEYNIKRSITLDDLLR
jgi:hypothetical protein